MVKYHKPVVNVKQEIITPLSDKLNYYNIKGNKTCSLIFVTSNKGIFKSVDYGKNWHITKAPKKNIHYNSLFVSEDGKNIVAGANKGSFIIEDMVVIYSNDYGNTWSNGEITKIRGSIIRNIVEYGGKLLLLTGKGLIFNSADYGKTWKKISTLRDGYFNSLFSTKKGLFLVNNKNDLSYLKSSISYGLSWYNFKKINRAYSLMVSKNHQNFIYINYEKPNYNIYVSKSYGKVWKKTFTIKSHIYLVADENCKNVVCVSVKNKLLYVSNNYGMTWKKIKPQNFTNNLVLINHNNTFNLAL